MFSLDAKEHVMEVVAFNTHSRNVKTFTRPHFEEVAKAVIGGLRVGSPSQLFEEVLYRSSLIRPSVSGGYEFAHLSFQEFLSAKHLTRRADFRELDTLLDEEWWHGTMAFYFGIRRSLDGIQLPRRKRARGHGLKFMEFLVEADYTSRDRKEQVYELIAADLLRAGPMTMRDLEVCARLKDDLIEILAEVLRGQVRTRAGGEHFLPCSAYNVLRLLLVINSERSLGLLLDREGALESLGSDELVDVLRMTIGARLGRQWIAYFSSGIEVIAHRFRDGKCDNRAKVHDGILELRRMLTRLHDEGDDRHDAITRALNEIENAKALI